MRLKNNLNTKTGWEIFETSFEPEHIVTTGSNFMLGNGYLGYRGTFAEWEKDRYVASIVSDTYDAAQDNWRELCNVPNGLYTKLYLDGEMMSAFHGETRDYQRMLDMRHGLFSRSQQWENDHGSSVSVDIEKFASFDNIHLIAMKYRFRVEQDTEVEVLTGTDGKVWSLHGEHFKTHKTFFEDAFTGIECVTGEKEIQVYVVEGMNIQGSSPSAMEIFQHPRRTLRRLTFSLKAGQEVILEKVVAIYTSNDVLDPREKALSDLRAALQTGYQALKAAHQQRWDAIWEVSDLQIEGNLEDQTITRFNLYQNIIATPAHADLPIGARGLSCQVYQGAAFWDQEIFNLPMFLYTQPDLARSILKYRYDTLNGAREKAQRLGYYGAFYAWTSGKTGEELFPDYFFTDVLTGRKVRNHFNDWQIHISPDIVYALCQYYRATEDWDFIVRYGAEIAFEVAQFLVSHVYFKKDKNRYEFIRLLGPDEYHENVDNNAFTNYQAKFALESALLIYERMKTAVPEKLEALFNHLGLGEQDIENWREISDLVYLPQPDSKTNLVEQFDGYFDLEDLSPDALRQRLLDPEEYWGWPNGIAVRTQVLKQADVLQLLALHDLFSVEVNRTNFDYYEPRTEHGSSLSSSVHSLIASKAGKNEQAYAYFKEGATIDIYNASKKVMSGGSFLGGIHTAACGGTWLAIVQGFAGFTVEEKEVRFQPRLPKNWTSLCFKIALWGNLLEVEVKNEQVAIRACKQNEEPVKVTVGEQTWHVNSGESKIFNV